MEWLDQVVGRHSYGCDVMFRVVGMDEQNGEVIAILAGLDVRLMADAPVTDLRALTAEEIDRMQTEMKQQEARSLDSFSDEARTQGDAPIEFFHLPGRVLHIDGDERYLEKCKKVYDSLNVPVIGLHCPEKEMPGRIREWLETYRPQLLVITGHDAYLPAKGSKSDLYAYRHSLSYVQAVQEARRWNANLDQLIIFAGACQSHFESLIHAGANFASSPLRVNIHALDPVYVACKTSYTSFKTLLTMRELLHHTLATEEGVGGIETNGLMRTGMPYRAEMFSE